MNPYALVRLRGKDKYLLLYNNISIIAIMIMMMTIIIMTMRMIMYNIFWSTCIVSSEYVTAQIVVTRRRCCRCCT